MLCRCTYRFGVWIHNNTNIGTTGKYEDYFRTRDKVQHIHLSRRAMYNVCRPTGEFCCELPDASGVTLMQCVEFV